MKLNEVLVATKEFGGIKPMTVWQIYELFEDGHNRGARIRNVTGSFANINQVIYEQRFRVVEDAQDDFIQLSEVTASLNSKKMKAFRNANHNE